jgi:hypothetical protein
VRFCLAILIAASALAASILPLTAQGYYRRGYPLDEYGRSTDPNCYRGPNQIYVCGTRRSYGYQGDHYEPRGYRRGPSYELDQYGRSTDPNCYRGRYGAYVC